MIEIVLHKDPNSFTPPPQFLTLPASRWDFLDACARLQIKDIKEAYVDFGGTENMHHLNRALRNIGPSPNYMAELNFLAYRLQQLRPDERFLMDGLVYMHGPESLYDLINLTYNLENVMIAGDIETDYQLGMFLVENEFVRFPEEVIPYLDFAKIGSDHRANNTCAIVNGVYFEDNRDELIEIYDGVTLPSGDEPEYVFKVSIRNPEQDADTDLFHDLTLPATDDEINNALVNIGIACYGEEMVCNFQSRITDFTELRADEMSLELLSDLADRIAAMDDAEYIKYKAVLECEGVLRVCLGTDSGEILGDLLDCACRLDEYTFAPEITADRIGSYGYVCPSAEAPELEPDHCPQMGGI